MFMMRVNRRVTPAVISRTVKLPERNALRAGNALIPGRALLQTVVESPPYPGAKNHFLIGENIEERDLMSKLFKVTGYEIPEPKPKKPKSKGASGSR